MGMIIKYVCDRCGKEYKPDEVDEYYFLTEHDSGHGESIGLCQLCQDSLKNWMNEKTENLELVTKYVKDKEWREDFLNGRR